MLPASETILCIGNSLQVEKVSEKDTILVSMVFISYSNMTSASESM